MDMDYYWKSRQSKDNAGNNSCHFCFEIEEPTQRYQFLTILNNEQIGDLNKRNKLGYLPHEI